MIFVVIVVIDYLFDNCIEGKVYSGINNNYGLFIKVIDIVLIN